MESLRHRQDLSSRPHFAVSTRMFIGQNHPAAAVDCNPPRRGFSDHLLQTQPSSPLVFAVWVLPKTAAPHFTRCHPELPFDFLSSFRPRAPPCTPNPFLSQSSAHTESGYYLCITPTSVHLQFDCRTSPSNPQSLTLLSLQCSSSTPACFGAGALHSSCLYLRLPTLVSCTCPSTCLRCESHPMPAAPHHSRSFFTTRSSH